MVIDAGFASQYSLGGAHLAMGGRTDSFALSLLAFPPQPSPPFSI